MYCTGAAYCCKYHKFRGLWVSVSICLSAKHNGKPRNMTEPMEMRPRDRLWPSVIHLTFHTYRFALDNISETY